MDVREKFGACATVPTGGEVTMVWEKPDFVEVRMDAEINCYVLTLE